MGSHSAKAGGQWLPQNLVVQSTQTQGNASPFAPCPYHGQHLGERARAWMHDADIVKAIERRINFLAECSCAQCNPHLRGVVARIPAINGRIVPRRHPEPIGSPLVRFAGPRSPWEDTGEGP